MSINYFVHLCYIIISKNKKKRKIILFILQKNPHTLHGKYACVPICVVTFVVIWLPMYGSSKYPFPGINFKFEDKSTFGIPKNSNYKFNHKIKLNFKSETHLLLIIKSNKTWNNVSFKFFFISIYTILGFPENL